MDAGKLGHVGRGGLTTTLGLLRLGRVSNLPTVWSNCLAGLVLAGGMAAGPLALPDLSTLMLPMLAMSLFYVGGMFLNDVCDRDIDAAQRPTRPIPSGAVDPALAAILGGGMLATGVALLAIDGLVPFVVGLALAGAIVAYDVEHKANALSPLVMGLCRMLVYVGAAVTLMPMVPGNVLIGGLLLLSHVVGLTYAAKLETGDDKRPLWPLLFLAAPLVMTLPYDNLPALPFWLLLLGWTARAVFVLRRGGRQIGRAVGMLIAGISLLDAVLLVESGSLPGALAAVVAFVLAYLLQRVVPGT